MEFRILGALEVLDGQRPVTVAGGKQRLLLAMLLAGGGGRVSRDVLSDALWPDRAAGDSAHALDLQISRLRRVVGPDRLVTHDGGYSLEVSGSEVDADRFGALVAEAGGRPPSEAATRLRAALALWRGPPFGTLGDEQPLRAPARVLEDRRVEALEALFDAELALGCDATIVRELEALVAERPLRERPCEQLMLALYRCSRQADALRVYDDLRRRLAEELGIGPGENARRLHEAIVRQDPALRRPGPTPIADRRRRRPALIAASAAAVLLLVGIALTAGGDGSQSATARASWRVPVSPQSLAFIDLRNGRVLAAAPIGPELTDGNASLAQGRGVDWVATGSGALLQVDSRRHRIARSISLGVPPAAIVVGLGSVWVLAADRPLLLRIDPVYGAVERRYRLPAPRAGRPDRPSGVAVAAGSVWVAQGEQRVLRIDPRSGRTLARIPAPGATSLAATDEAVWVAGGHRGALYRIDPVTDAVVTRVGLDSYVCCVAVGGGYVWAMNHRVWKLSSEGRVMSSISIDGDGANLAWTGGAIWVSEGRSGQETRIEPSDDSTRTLSTGGLALLTAVHGGVATVVTATAPPDLLAGIDGPVARIELDPDGLQPDDPALASRSAVPLWREQALDATCARLLTLRTAPPPLAWRTAPEVADLPTSPDGRVWTFRVRPGFRFSPPSNAQVTAASMRHTIERALSPRMGSTAPARGVLGDVVGLAAFRSGRARHISGLSAHGDRLAVRLRAPARDLALRMTSRAFCAVPDDTPAGSIHFASTPIPSAGPYYLAAHYGGLAALLRRNPNYDGPRRGRFAAFLYEMAVQLPAGVDRVTLGRADLVAGAGDALGPRSSAARRFGETDRGRQPHWSRPILPATDLLLLRAHAGPLTDGRLRRAVALALDRPAMAALLGDVPTGHALPPRVAGSVAVVAPQHDPARARSLVGRRHVTLVFGGCRARPGCRALGSLIQMSLGRAGIAVQLRPAARDADLTFLAATMATPDPLGFLAALGGPRAPVPRPAPARAAARARRIDTRLTRNGATFPIGTPTIGELASSRLSCRTQRALSFGDDLAALCPAG